MLNRLISLSLILAGAAVFSFSCSRSDPEIWFEDSLRKVFPDTLPSDESLADFPITYAARNSHASIQIVIRSKEAVSEFGIVLKQPVMGTRALPCTLRPVGLVPVGSNTPKSSISDLIRKAPALFPDPLYEELPTALEAGTSQSFRVIYRNLLNEVGNR